MSSLEEKVGQKLVAGFEGFAPSSNLYQLIEESKIGGVILFKRNVDNILQLSHLCQELQSLSPIPLLICIDQEGGRVSRLKEPFTPFPSASILGKTGDSELALAQGCVMARELRAAGINVNLAPVLDVNTNPLNPVIGDRALGDDPELVAKMGIQLIKGFKMEGIIGVGKHFPGHGDTSLDSHYILPCVDKTEEEMKKVELLPFQKAISAGLDMIMTAHVLYPKLDPKFPATLSEIITQRILRKNMGFEGVVITDDMRMKAITLNFPWDEALIKALESGCDLILICTNDPLEDYNILLGYAKSHKKAQHMIEESWLRIKSLKDRYLSHSRDGFQTRPYKDDEILRIVGNPEHKRISEKIMKGGSYAI